MIHGDVTVVKTVGFHCVSLTVVIAAEKILTASPRRTGGDHQDPLVLCGWRLSSKNWDQTISHWV